VLTIISGLTSYSTAGTLPHVTDKNLVTSYRLRTGGGPMELVFVVLLVVLVDLAAIRSGADSRPSFYDKPARSI